MNIDSNDPTHRVRQLDIVFKEMKRLTEAESNDPNVRILLPDISRLELIEIDELRRFGMSIANDATTVYTRT